jgi:hypothetical protein
VHDRIEWWFAALMRFQAGEKVEPPPWLQPDEVDRDELLWQSLKAMAEKNKPREA